MNGNLKAFLIKHNKEFERLITAERKDQCEYDSKSRDIGMDLSLLITWSYQVRLCFIFNQWPILSKYILWDNGFISILSFFKYPNHTFIVKRNFHIIFFFLWLHVHFGEKPFAKRQ